VLQEHVLGHLKQSVYTVIIVIVVIEIFISICLPEILGVRKVTIILDYIPTCSCTYNHFPPVNRVLV
jgi:hypothetical protein